MCPVDACLVTLLISLVVYLPISFQCHFITLAVIFRSKLFKPEEVWISQVT